MYDSETGQLKPTGSHSVPTLNLNNQHDLKFATIHANRFVRKDVRVRIRIKITISANQIRELVYVTQHLTFDLKGNVIQHHLSANGVWTLH